MRTLSSLHEEKVRSAVHYIWQDRDNAGLPGARDGSWGFSIGGNDYIAFGWIAGTHSLNDFYRSSDGGITYLRQPDLPFIRRHTAATFNLDGIAYVVGGDPFSPVSDSWSFNGKNWTQKASDCGIGGRNLIGAVHHEGAFYLVGGQVGRYIRSGRFDTVMRSTDNCRSFQEIAKTPFKGGNLWGSVASFRGRIWKIGGGIYDDRSLRNRTYPREIYSSADGIAWRYEGLFPGHGRQYHQTLVHDDKLWVIGGVNTENPLSSCNLNDTWYSENGTHWIRKNGSDLTALHAPTCWTGADGNLHTFGGSTNPGTTITNKYHILRKTRLTWREFRNEGNTSAVGRDFSERGPSLMSGK